jgi:tetratricopeptide (TPR) repeat protein
MACQQRYDSAAEALVELQSRADRMLSSGAMRGAADPKAYLAKYIDLAQIAEQQGDYAEAERFYKKTLEIYKENVSGNKDDHGTAILYRDLAAVTYKLKRPEEAIKYLSDSLAIKKRLPAVTQDEMISTKLHLASLYVKHRGSESVGRMQSKDLLLDCVDRLGSQQGTSGADGHQSQRTFEKQIILSDLKEQLTKSDLSEEQLRATLPRFSRVHSDFDYREFF